MECLARGEHGVLVGMKMAQITVTPYAEVIAHKKTLDMRMVELARVLAK